MYMGIVSGNGAVGFGSVASSAADGMG